jgi:Major Facilitator Superfamily
MKPNSTHIRSDACKWLVLALGTFTFTFVVAVPSMSLPVLFDEISTDLALNLVQIGWIWGIGSVLGIWVGLIGGSVGDRFGPRRTLAVACTLMGIAGAARGLSNGFAMLAQRTRFSMLEYMRPRMMQLNPYRQPGNSPYAKRVSLHPWNGWAQDASLKGAGISNAKQAWILCPSCCFPSN